MYLVTLILLGLLAINSVSLVSSKDECVESALCHTAKNYIWKGILSLIEKGLVICPKLEALISLIHEEITADEQFRILSCIDTSEHCRNVYEQVSRCVQWWLTPTACHFRDPSITCGDNGVCTYDEKELQCVYQPEICRLMDRLTESFLIAAEKQGKLILKRPCQDLTETIRCCNLRDEHFKQVLLLTRETCGWGIKKDRHWTCKQVKCYKHEMPKMIGVSEGVIDHNI